MELVTGRAGSPHITSQQDRQKHQGIWGTGAYILKTGNNLEPVVQSSNSIQIKDGALMSQGALFSVKVGTVDEVTIANGSQGMMRKDVIVARYTYNQGTNTENAEWEVVQGTPAASNPQIPQITEGDIQAGDATVDTSVFIVTLDGINITSVDVVPELAPDIAELKALIDELNGKMPVIQSGTGVLSYANYAVCTARVYFPEPFEEIPDITIAPIVPSEGSWNSTRNSITNSTYMIAGKTKEYFDVRSFSIQDDYTETLTIQFDWTAKL